MAQIILINNSEPGYQTLGKGLSHYGYKTVVASGEDELLLLAITKSPDLILMDIEASGSNSWQTIKILKQSKLTWLIPVIAIANPNIEGQLLVQAGFDAYYRKPVSLKHLLPRIEALLDIAASQTKTAKGVSDVSIADRGNAASGTISSREPVVSHPLVYIDDNPTDSQVMADIIKKAGYSYANISDSLQALPQLLELKPQLIFIDLVMPMANGYELCAQIRRISVFKKTPLIIVTNNNGIADRLRSKLVGAHDFLHKPIREKRVLQVLQKYGCKSSVREMILK